MSPIANNLNELRGQLPPHVTLVAVTKTKSPALIMEAYEAGQRIFGENRVQEMVEKHALLPDDIQWHQIGHLQTNKVKYIAPFVSMIHSVDSDRLLVEIDKQAKLNERIIDVLLQVHIAREETKFGMNEDELFQLIEKLSPMHLTGIRVRGLMGIATFTDDMDLVRAEMKYLKSLFDQLSTEPYLGNQGFNQVSMGMTGDYLVAIEEGSTLIRIGTLIFGSR